MPPYLPITLPPSTPSTDKSTETQLKDYPVAQLLSAFGSCGPHYEGCIGRLKAAYDLFNNGSQYDDVAGICTTLIDAIDCPVLVYVEALQLRAMVTTDRTQSANDRAQVLRKIGDLPRRYALVDRLERVKARTAVTQLLITQLTLKCRRLIKIVHTRKRLAAQEWQTARRALRLDPCGSGDRRALKQKARRILDEIGGHRSLGEEEKFLEAVSLGRDAAEGARYFLNSLS